MDSRRRETYITSTYVHRPPAPRRRLPRVTLWSREASGPMAAPLSTALLVAKFMGRERATPLAGAALHYHKRTAEGCEWRPERGRRGEKREGGSDLETENTRTGRTHYLCLAQIRTLHFAFKRWMQCRCRRHNICDTLVVVK